MSLRQEDVSGERVRKLNTVVLSGFITSGSLGTPLDTKNCVRGSVIAAHCTHVVWIVTRVDTTSSIISCDTVPLGFTQVMAVGGFNAILLPSMRFDLSLLVSFHVAI